MIWFWLLWFSLPLVLLLGTISFITAPKMEFGGGQVTCPTCYGTGYVGGLVHHDYTQNKPCNHGGGNE